MRIESNPITRLLQTQLDKTRAARPGAAKADGESLELSDRARTLRSARAALDAAPAMDAQRVAEIKQQLANGSYQVTPEDVADKLLGSQ